MGTAGVDGAELLLGEGAGQFWPPLRGAALTTRMRSWTAALEVSAGTLASASSQVSPSR
jgi:hypothetical protein